METKGKKTVFGTKEWASSTLNLISGCAHDCKYCYAKETAVRKGFNTLAEWPNEKVRQNQLKRHQKKRDGTIMYPSSHDITPEHIEEHVKIIGKLLQAGNQLLIVSKPHLECIKRLCLEFEESKHRILFRFTIGSTNSNVLKFWEPNAPSFEERLECLQLAFESGFGTSVSSEPSLANSTDQVFDLVEKVRPFLNDAIWIGKMNNPYGRVKRNGHTDMETLKRLDDIVGFQNDANIWIIYQQYKNDPIVKWKESIKKVVGLEIPTEAGKDV